MDFKIILCLVCLVFSSADASILSTLENWASTIISYVTGNTVSSSKTYDFIIVGAGTAGSALANRLSENNSWNILLLEAGGSASALDDIPVISTYFQLTDYNWGYKVEPQTNACLGMNDQQCAWPRGKAVGGSTVLYYMIHTRGNKLDFDEWVDLGNEGWSSEEVLPYFKRSEKFNIPELYNSTWHNESGNLCVEYPPYHTELATAYLQAGEDMGYKILDYNAEEQIGFSYIQANMEEGRRCSAAKAYLSEDKSNLDIVTGVRVTKVLIDDKNKTYGVQYVKDGTYNEVNCTKEVILSAGSIDSAKLLMLSGIGPKDHLEEMDIDVIRDSKVGYNLREQLGVLGLTFIVNQTVALVQSRFLKLSVLLDYIANHNGPLTVAAGAEAIAFLRTKYAEDERPDLELLFAGGSLNSDDGSGVKKAQGITDEIYDTVYKPIEGVDTWSIWPIVLHPKSVGRLTLQSNDPLDAPIMDPKFLNDSADLEVLLEGVKLAVNISQSTPFQKFGTRLHDIKLPGCESYEFATDDYWRCHIRYLPVPMEHPIGTVKMGNSSDPDAVVDPELKVYGITGLRVCDASVIPTQPSGHPNAIITMIAERTADLIKQSWA